MRILEQETKVTKRQLTFVVAGAAVFAAVAGTVRATSSSGVVSAAIQARAAFADPVDIKFKVGAGEVIHVRESRDTVMQKIVLGPGGHTWLHRHHGPAVVLVQAGALTLYFGDDPTCTGRTYPAGQAFVDSGPGHVHIGR